MHEYFRCPHLPVSLTHIAAATANIHYKNQFFILTLLSVSFNKFNFVGCSLNSDSHRNYKNIFLWAVWLRVTAKWAVRSNGLYYSRFSVCSCISNTRVIFRDTGSVPKEITFCQLTKWPVRSNSVYSSRFSVSSCILKYTSNILRHRKCSQGNNVLSVSRRCLHKGTVHNWTGNIEGDGLQRVYF